MKFIDDYLKLMICVIKADDVIHKGEEELFLNMLKDLGISSSAQNKYNKLLFSTKSADIAGITSRVAKNVNRSMMPWLVCGAFLMADADGKILEEEIQVIKQLLEKSGFSPKQFTKVKQWGLEYVKHTKKGIKLFSEKP